VSGGGIASASSAAWSLKRCGRLIVQVDAFAEAVFRGNPSAVVLVGEDGPSAALMQSIAAENNQTTTAFLRRGPGASGFALRWFTPTIEEPACGHATLAAAWVVFDTAQAVRALRPDGDRVALAGRCAFSMAGKIVL
jgi:predicted PhzF superfamily epimerase YddE/YHI9